MKQYIKIIDNVNNRDITIFAEDIAKIVRTNPSSEYKINLKYYYGESETITFKEIEKRDNVYYDIIKKCSKVSKNSME